MSRYRLQVRILLSPHRDGGVAVNITLCDSVEVGSIPTHPSMNILRKTITYMSGSIVITAVLALLIIGEWEIALKFFLIERTVKAIWYFIHELFYK